MAIEIPGICGPNPSAVCKIAWADKAYANDVGIYPSEYLPNSNTLWHGVFTSSFGVGITPVPIIPTLIGGVLQMPFNPTVPGIPRHFQSRMIVTFAKTSNRFNTPYTLTKEDIESADDGVLVLTLNDYIFQVAFVTDYQVEIPTELTPEELSALTDESEEDKLFRKIFEIEVGRNLFAGIVPNSIGMEYRLDNDSENSKKILDSPGSGEQSASIHDTTSRRMLVRIDGKKEGDIIYLTYIAVTKHYMRQYINASWFFVDAGIGQNISFPTDIKVIHFRFFKWDEYTEGPPDPNAIMPVGWRAIETYYTKPNFFAPIGFEEPPVGALTAGSSSSKDGNIAYDELSTNYKDTDWWPRLNFKGYENYKLSTEHVFYNVHPKALQKPDAEKYAFERNLKTELEKDIRAGKPSNFPFWDRADLESPRDDPTANDELLSSSNTEFQHVKPLQKYTTANLTAIADNIGSFIGVPRGELHSYNAFNSNSISDRFDKQTRLLVEKFFAVGTGVHNNIITIEGIGKLSASVSCISDPSRQYTFLIHSDDNSSFLTYNTFGHGTILETFDTVQYRPDLPVPTDDGFIINVEDFSGRSGYTGMIGQIPGFSVGRVVAHDSTEESTIVENPDVNDADGIFFVNLDHLYHSRTVIQYSCKNNPIENKENPRPSEDAMIWLVFKEGGTSGSIRSIVDSVRMPTGEEKFLAISHRYMSGRIIEFHTENVENFQLNQVAAESIPDDIARDFLAEVSFSPEPTTAPLFFKTDVATIAEDVRSHLYIFFNDSENGISCAVSNDYGIKWHFYYGIILPIPDNSGPISCSSPFSLPNYGGNEVNIFYECDRKVLVKNFSFDLFNFKDASKTVGSSTSTGEEETKEPEEGDEEVDIGLSQNGQLIRNAKSFIVCGDYNSGELVHADNNLVTKASLSYFKNRDIENLYFSAIRTDKGILQLFYMGDTEDGLELQCQFSSDGGRVWTDNWEYANYRGKRIRIGDHGSFIDTTASGESLPSSEDLYQTDPENTSENFEFGINIHWSRLKKDKVETEVEGEPNVNSESKIMDISSPYVFLQNASQKIFIFYVYEGCLLCKIVDVDTFFPPPYDEEKPDDTGMNLMKKIIERNTRAYFVDGDIGQLDKSEIHDFYNEETNELMGDGNIIFPYSSFWENFDGREITPQRVCAYEISNAYVRVFYKTDKLQAAVWNGSTWMVEAMLKDTEELSFDSVTGSNVNTNTVTGGFGDDKF